MSVDPSHRSPREEAPRLSRPLISALERTPGFRRASPPSGAGPWATLWLLGTTAGIATPLAIHTFVSSRPPAPVAGGSPTVAARVDGSRMGHRQSGPLPASAATALQAGERRPAATDQALAAAFSSLPSPFSGEAAPADLSGEPPSTANDTPALNREPASAGFRGPAASRLGGALSLADRLDGPLQSFDRPARPDPRLQADTADPLARRWGEHLRALVQHTPLVLPVEVVRMRSRSVDRPQAIPMALWPDGSATTNVEPPDPTGQQLAQDWVRSQPPLVEGSVRPVVMVLEPETPAPVVSTTATTAPQRPEPAPPAPAPAWESPAPASEAEAAATPPPSPVAVAPETAPAEAAPAPSP